MLAKSIDALVLGVDRLPITSVKLDLSEKVPLTVAAALADAEVVFPVVTLVLVVAFVLTPRVAANAPKGRLANTRATIGRASFFMDFILRERRSRRKRRFPFGVARCILLRCKVYGFV